MYNDNERPLSGSNSFEEKGGPRGRVGGSTRLIVNGERVPLSGLLPGERLLDVLRDRLGLKGTKEGCGRGECGACTVLVDDRPVLSCITLAARVREGRVETIEGLAAEAGELRAGFADHGGFQCGFCTPGQIVRGVSLLRAGLPGSDAELRRQMSGNVCRCTGYNGIVAALRQAEAASADRGEAITS